MRRAYPGFTCILAVSLAGLGGGAARAESKRVAPRLISAYDPALHAKPPTMIGRDGRAATLMIDADFDRQAAAFRAANPRALRAEGGITQIGEVVVVEGSDETLAMTETGGTTVRLEAVARKVIAKYGDHFAAITLWLTFDDARSRAAEAYEVTAQVDVRGLGMDLRDNSPQYGSNGVLRSVLNMKRVWGRVNNESIEQWRPHLETWGQESGHRWMVFMQFVDPRTGQKSDALLGRDCAHYHRLVHTQASVHDGLFWNDNHNGSFTSMNVPARFSDLDLYGMGVLPADEVTPFFFIDEVPGYTRPLCSSYELTAEIARGTVMGKRVDLTIDNVIAAEGPRIPAADQKQNGLPQDYFREVQVVVTAANETADSTLPQRVAQRVDKARLLWEEWMRAASGNRMVVCTKVSADCGDPRSDVTSVHVNPARKSPAAGPTVIEAVVTNTGGRASTGITAKVEVRTETGVLTDSKNVGMLNPGETRTVPLAVDLRGVPCGTKVALKAATQSDFHRHRVVRTELVGGESRFSEGFEAGQGSQGSSDGWVVNPDNNDTSMGAVWERGTPEWTEIEIGLPVQPDGAHEGKTAFVTGAVASIPGKETFVRAGRTTLQSPAIDGTGWRSPHLRYWLSFSGMQDSGSGIVPSPNARFVVQARGEGGADGGTGGDWLEVDRVENVITTNWVERIVALPESLAGGKVTFRFIAEDANPRSGGVEAALDDVEVLSLLPACFEPVAAEKGGGGGCQVGAGAGGLGVAGMLGVLLGGLGIARGLRRRRA